MGALTTLEITGVVVGSILGIALTVGLAVGLSTSTQTTPVPTSSEFSPTPTAAPTESPGGLTTQNGSLSFGIYNSTSSAEVKFQEAFDTEPGFTSKVVTNATLFAPGDIKTGTSTASTTVGSIDVTFNQWPTQKTSTDVSTGLGNTMHALDLNGTPLMVFRELVDQARICRSTDGELGTTWASTTVSTSGSSIIGSQLFVSAAGVGVILATVNGGLIGFMSTDNGVSFPTSLTGLPSSGVLGWPGISVDPSNPNNVELVYGEGTNIIWYRSTNGGQAWTSGGNIYTTNGAGLQARSFIYHTSSTTFLVAFRVSTNNIRIMYYDGSSWLDRGDVPGITDGGYDVFMLPVANDRYLLSCETRPVGTREILVTTCDNVGQDFSSVISIYNMNIGINGNCTARSNGILGQIIIAGSNEVLYATCDKDSGLGNWQQLGTAVQEGFSASQAAYIISTVSGFGVFSRASSNRVIYNFIPVKCDLSWEATS